MQQLKRILFQRGANPELLNSEGLAALHLVAKAEDKEEVGMGTSP